MTYTDEELLARVEYASDLIDTLVTLAADMERHAVDEWDESDFIILDAVPAAQVRSEALEEAAALPPYDSDGDPAGSFDHHVFVKRDAIRTLIEKEQT